MGTAQRVSPVSANNSQPLVALGAVMGAHGVRGELRVKPYNEASDLLPRLTSVTVRHGETERAYGVQSVRVGPKGLIFQLTGISTPEQVKALYGAELCVPHSALPKLDPGEFYFVDLPGLEVVRADGSALGRCEGVLEYPASSVLRVVTEAGMLEVPMVAPYLVSVDVDAGRITVDQLEDLELEKPGE